MKRIKCLNIRFIEMSYEKMDNIIADATKLTIGSIYAYSYR